MEIFLAVCVGLFIVIGANMAMLHMRKRMSDRAFTLVEILIVVVILGILSAIVIPQIIGAANDPQHQPHAAQPPTSEPAEICQCCKQPHHSKPTQPADVLPN